MTWPSLVRNGQKQDSNTGQSGTHIHLLFITQCCLPKLIKSITIYGNHVDVSLGFLKYIISTNSLHVPHFMLILSGKFSKQSYYCLLWKYFHVYKAMENVLVETVNESVLNTHHVHGIGSVFNKKVKELNKWKSQSTA